MCIIVNRDQEDSFRVKFIYIFIGSAGTDALTRVTARVNKNQLCSSYWEEKFEDFGQYKGTNVKLKKFWKCTIRDVIRR